MSTSNTTGRRARPNRGSAVEPVDAMAELRSEFHEAARLQGAAALLAKEVGEFEAEVNRPSFTRSRSRMIGALRRVGNMVQMIVADLEHSE